MIKKTYIKIFPGFAQELKKQIGDCKSLLDVGCGSSSPIQYIRFKGYSLGIDGFAPSIKKSKIKHIHSKYKKMSLQDIHKHIKPKSFECVIALDVIEHFTKKEARELMLKMEKIATKKVIIFTNNGFMHQESYDGNILQIHKSGWSPKEMSSMGYKVVGIHGWKALRGEYSELKFSPKFVWRVISDITQKITRNSPNLAYAILCIKDLQNDKK
jgi:hypothetical protein